MKKFLVLLLLSVNVQAQFRLLTFNDIPSLTNANPSSINGMVLVRTNSYDTLGRFYYYSSSSVEADNPPGILTPLINSGRWIEIGIVPSTSTFTNITNFVTIANLTEDLGTGSSVTVDFGNGIGLKRWGPITGAGIVSFLNVPSGTNEITIQLDILNSSTNDYALTWPGGIDWNISTDYSLSHASSTNTMMLQYNGNQLRGFNKVQGGSSSTNIGWQRISSGSDFNFAIGSGTFEKITFGAGDPDFVLTNAGVHQIIMTVAASAANSFPQSYYLTNITDAAMIPGSFHSINVSSDEAPLVIAIQYETSASNKSIELWGATADSTTYATAGVLATNTILDVIEGGIAGGGSGGTTINPTDNVLPVRSSGTTFADSPLSISGLEVLYGSLVNAGVFLDRTTTNAAISLAAANTVRMIMSVGAVDADNYVQIYDSGANLVTELNPAVASSGSSIAYLLNTSSVQTNGDLLLSIKNAGIQKAFIDFSGTARFGVDTEGNQLHFVDPDRTSSTWFGTDGLSVNLAVGLGSLSWQGNLINSTNGWSFVPTVSDGITPFRLDTSIAHTTGQLLSVFNNGTNKFVVSANSGYTGSGTNFLGDDGSYHNIVSDGTNTIVQQLGPFTVNYIPKAIATNALGDSIMHMTGATNLTIGGNVAIDGVLTISGKTNQISDSGTQLLYNGNPVGSFGTVGTIINTGASTTSKFPQYTDTTGTNVAPHTITTSDLPGSGASTITDGAGIGAGATLTVGSAYTVSATSATPQWTREGLGVAADSTHILTLRTPSISSSTRLINGSEQWNSGGTIFELDFLNVTNTASSSSSTLWDRQVGGVSQGKLTVGGNFAITGNYNLPTTGLISWISGSKILATTDGNVRMQNNAGSGFTSLSLGAANSSTVSQVGLNVGVGNGTDSGANTFTIDGGDATGAGRGGFIRMRTSNAAGTGSSNQTLSERYHAVPKWVALTESSATTVLNLAISSSKYAGVELFCTIDADNGSDFQSISSRVSFDAVNKGGTVTVGAVTQTDNTTAASSGTLTVTYTAVANGSGVDVKANAVSSLTQTTLNCKMVVTALNTDDAGTFVEQ